TPLTTSDSEPEPDVVVLAGEFDDYAMRHPSAQDVALVVEVADTSLSRDRGLKLRIYARAGIPVYWILNLHSHALEIYTNPQGDEYTTRQTLSETAIAVLPLGAEASIQVPVAQLLPPARS
ncbi:MAG: Uma2 family endonuclease, partial [Bryobacterales bacterium]|nr:Uma2 family endonuclease [Bryobacterales bacterium]